ncbi:chemotaxis protein CheD [bacterium]|nr:chemotaxis protein CheD [bacterium]
MADEEKIINVGLGQAKVVGVPDMLSCIGLGSCVALCLYHSISRTAGMAHIMLPVNPNNLIDPERPAKYADAGFVKLLEIFEKKGIPRDKLVAKIVGGAELFHFKNFVSVGRQNIEVVKELLIHYNIPLTENSSGGSAGKSIWFSSIDGSIKIRSKLGKIFYI